MPTIDFLWHEYKIPLIFGAVSIILVGLSITLLVKSAQTARPIEFSTDTHVASVAGSMAGIMVDVAGAVVKPGVYQLAMGARVEEALAAAGGLAQNADSDWVAKNINRAMKINDGVKIYVPKVGEIEASHIGDYATSIDVAQSYGIVTTSNGQSQNTISINLSSQSELESLAGVGPVTAQKIITNRPYTSLDELVSKKAIGQSLYDKIKNKLSL